MPSLLRREPKQDRSRDRIEGILRIALMLIGQTGIDGVTMKQVAALSGGPIASIYQYFPNKSAIVATLFKQHCSSAREIIGHCLLPVSIPEDIAVAAWNIFERNYLAVRQTPDIQDLLNSIMADKSLQGLDLKEKRYQAKMFYDATHHLVPTAERQAYGRTVLLLFHLAAGMVRLALMLPTTEADGIVSAFRSMTHDRLHFGQR